MPKKVTKKTEKEIANISKFQNNPFAKKYKTDLLKIEYGKLSEQELLEASDQVKSWNRSPISQTVNLTYLFLAFIIGFSVCAVVVTPLVINSI